MGIIYRGVTIAPHYDECGTELNFVGEDGGWEPIPSYCYVSEKHLTMKEIKHLLERTIEVLEKDVDWYKRQGDISV